MKTTHHILGEQVEQNAALMEQYRQLLLLVGRIKSGEVHPDNVVIDVPRLSWTQVNYVVENPEPAPPLAPESNHVPAPSLGGGSTVS